jgi:di/tricarboxylate transporter
MSPRISPEQCDEVGLRAFSAAVAWGVLGCGGVWDDLSGTQLAFLAILVVSFALLLTERLRNDVVAILIVLALSATRLLSPKDALSGFGSEPAIVVAAIFVLSAGLHRTGLSETIGRWIGHVAGAGYAQAIAVIMPSVALLSAFTHHVTTTAVMLPVILDLSRKREIPASKLLMPLSFAASLGTAITIIGAPAFLIASGALRQAGRPGLGIFSIAPIGLALSAVGTLFVLLVGRFLLPVRKGVESNESRFRLDDYFTEVAILESSPLEGRTVDEVQADERFKFTVVGLLRGGQRLRRPLSGIRLRARDVLLVRAAPEQIVSFRDEPGVELHPVEQYQPAATATAEAQEEEHERLVQAVVAPGSELIGRTISEIDFRRRFGVIVLGLWRRQGWLEQELAQTRLRAGDVLVLLGDDESMARVGADTGFLMMVPFHGEPQARRKAPLAGLIMLGTILLAVFNVVSLEIAALAGAVAMVLTGCLTPAQAYRAIDARIYVFIAGAIPLGIAMEKSGAARLLGGWLQGVVDGWSEMLILLALFSVVGVITQFMSDAATTAIFAPVAVALASALDRPPEAYVVTVAMAAVVSFLTPIGHHGNLLVYGPGGYKFADFVKVGTPLTVLAALVVVFLAPLIWR